MIQKTFTLNNGIKIPSIGYGTFQIAEGADKAVIDAMNCGYTHIDTAQMYKNEDQVGKGIEQGLKENGLKRKDLYITTKVSNESHGYNETKKAIEKSLNELQLDYIDLMLIHWPNPKFSRRIDGVYKQKEIEKTNETWTALEEAHNSGKIKSLGVSNFYIRHLIPLLEHSTMKPVINQLLIHPALDNFETKNLCKSHNILIENYSPLTRGYLLEDQYLITLGKKYNKSTSQILLNYSLQKNELPLPKSTHIERMKENLDIFDFDLTIEEVEKIDQLDWPEFKNPDTQRF